MSIYLIDQTTGSLTVEGLDAAQLALVSDLVGEPIDLNCARPLTPIAPTEPSVAPIHPIRVASVYHGSVAEGPGRRSVLQMQGCPIRCKGCYVPDTHDERSGVLLECSDALTMLLSPEGEPRDGVTILGGEPFGQPEALLWLLTRLDGQHVTLYTGYSIRRLRGMLPNLKEYLSRIDILIEGPFVAALSDGAGEWLGSRNQRIWQCENGPLS